MWCCVVGCVALCLDTPFATEAEGTTILRNIVKHFPNTADHIPKGFLLHIWTILGRDAGEAAYVIA